MNKVSEKLERDETGAKRHCYRALRRNSSEKEYIHMCVCSVRIHISSEKRKSEHRKIQRFTKGQEE
jgi:hypothetical protein